METLFECYDRILEEKEKLPAEFVNESLIETLLNRHIFGEQRWQAARHELEQRGYDLVELFSRLTEPAAYQGKPGYRVYYPSISKQPQTV